MRVVRNLLIAFAVCCCSKISAQSTDTLSNHYNDVDTLIEDSAVTVTQQHQYDSDTSSSSKKYTRMYMDEETLEALRKKNDFNIRI